MGYKDSDDLVRFKAKTTTLPFDVESFTILFNNVKPQSMDVELIWENTAVAFTINADIDSRIVKQIETAMAPGDRRPYFESASYYFESGKDMKQALAWASKAVEQNPERYWVEHLKAKIQMKMGDKKGAIESASRSIANAKTQKNPDYVVLNEKLIAEAKK
jgi:tetratricopeptide (TPR) repeat protein